jgi:integrative and conjugative element protein (TIGR02256 family)
MSARVHSRWRSSCGTYDVTVSTTCVQSMARLARSHLPREVGTALSGSYSDDGHMASVTGLAPVSPDSRGARFSFYRGARGLFEHFHNLFRSSRGRTHYVGEWHSHPGGAPHPSGTDDRNMLAIARDPKTLCPECILLILAIHGQGEDLGVFVYSGNRGRVVLERMPRPLGDPRGD